MRPVHLQPAPRLRQHHNQRRGLPRRCWCVRPWLRADTAHCCASRQLPGAVHWCRPELRQFVLHRHQVHVLETCVCFLSLCPPKQNSCCVGRRQQQKRTNTSFSHCGLSCRASPGGGGGASDEPNKYPHTSECPRPFIFAGTRHATPQIPQLAPYAFYNVTGPDKSSWR